MACKSTSSDIDRLDFVQSFARLCRDAWERGWHEANGGNLSYRLASDEADALRASSLTTSDWYPLDHPLPELGGELFLMTSSGAYLQSIACDLEANAGIIELSDDGKTWRACWGFEDARPSSEFMTHLAAYANSSENDDRPTRVVYHAHTPNFLSLSMIIPAESRIWTRTLWRCMTESIIMIPRGIAAVGWMVPGSAELAERTAEIMREYHACVWAHHGIMVRATSFDEAFGMVDTIEKAAGVYLAARSANGGGEPEFFVSDEQLRAICKRYGIDANEEFLD